MQRVRLIGQKLNISQICGLIAGLMILLSGILISTLTYSHLHGQLQSRLQQDAARQLQRLALATAPSLLKEDRITLSLTLSEWKLGPELTGIQVLNHDQQVIAETGSYRSGSTEITQPVTQDNVSAGVLRASISLDSASQTARHYLSLGLIASGLLALIAALAAYQLAERGLRYIRQLQQSLSQWQQDERPLTLPAAPAISEMLGIHQALNNIAQRELHQKAMQEALGRFVSAVDNKTQPLLRYHECALLFIEIQDLEVLQQRLSADELSQVLNQYHRLLSQAAKLYNGKIDRYLGDGVVMMFGLANPNTDHGNAALHCLYAAQLFLGLVAHLQDAGQQTLPVGFRIAAHWGNILLAPITHDDRTECNLIGDTVHWAYNLATNSEEHRLLVSQQLVEHLGTGNEISWEEGPLVSDLHGREQSSYWLADLPEKTSQLIQRQIKHITAMTENA